MDNLIELLQTNKISVQLKFLGEERRDYVRVVSSEGKELCAAEEMQHNKNYGAIGKNCIELCDKVTAALSANTSA